MEFYPACSAQVFSLLALELKVFPELAREDGVKGIAFPKIDTARAEKNPFRTETNLSS
jgi:hypothetical protein